MDKATQLNSAQRPRGIVKASVTRLEDRIQIYELRWERLNEDKLVIQRLSKKLEEQDAEFKKYHYAIVELLEDDNLEEQVKLDDHNNKIADCKSSPGSCWEKGEWAMQWKNLWLPLRP